MVWDSVGMLESGKIAIPSSFLAVAGNTFPGQPYAGLLLNNNSHSKPACTDDPQDLTTTPAVVHFPLARHLSTGLS
jgi:hypothetical protein